MFECEWPHVQVSTACTSLCHIIMQDSSSAHHPRSLHANQRCQLYDAQLNDRGVGLMPPQTHSQVSLQQSLKQLHDYGLDGHASQQGCMLPQRFGQTSRSSSPALVSGGLCAQEEQELWGSDDLPRADSDWPLIGAQHMTSFKAKSMETEQPAPEHQVSPLASVHTTSCHGSLSGMRTQRLDPEFVKQESETVQKYDSGNAANTDSGSFLNAQVRRVSITPCVLGAKRSLFMCACTACTMEPLVA